jgi:translation initiation factor 1
MGNSNSRLVYSSDGGRVRPSADPARAKRPRHVASDEMPPDPGDGFVRLHRGKPARKGKTRTIVVGLRGSDAELDSILKRYKQQLGTGGTRQNQVLVIQGDHREKLRTLLETDGYRVKLAGG